MKKAVIIFALVAIPLGGFAQEGSSYCPTHDWQRFVANTGVSITVAYGTKTALKTIIREERPDLSDLKSFPSGHTALAFAMARSIDKEFRKENVWIPITSYVAASIVGVERVINDRHHWHDVVAGSVIGLVSAEFTWWLSGKLFPYKDVPVAVGFTGNVIEMAVCL